MLQRAKFTRAQIATQQQKFYNLFRIAPLTTMEVSEMRKLREQNDELLAALKAARQFIKEHHDSFVETATSPITGLIEDAQDLLFAEADQDLLNSIDAAVAKATGAA